MKCSINNSKSPPAWIDSRCEGSSQHNNCSTLNHRVLKCLRNHRNVPHEICPLPTITGQLLEPSLALQRHSHSFTPKWPCGRSSRRSRSKAGERAQFKLGRELWRKLTVAPSKITKKTRGKSRWIGEVTQMNSDSEGGSGFRDWIKSAYVLREDSADSKQWGTGSPLAVWNSRRRKADFPVEW